MCDRPIGVARRLTGPIVVACGDSNDAQSALQTAQQLARRDKVAVHVIGVVPPLVIPPGTLSENDWLALQEGRRQRYLDRLQQRVNGAVGVSGHFTVDVAIGRRSRVLARAARAQDAVVIVTGLGRLGTDARVPTEDAALQLVLETDIPVLAVTEGSSLLPRRCLVALDFGNASQCAARSALLMLDSPSTLILAHVQAPLDDVDEQVWHDAYAQRAADLLDTTATRLAKAGGVTIETLRLEGDAAAAVLNAARTAVVDLVACGVEGVDMEAAIGGVRALPHAGSTSLALIHRAPSSVLVAPA